MKDHVTSLETSKKLMKAGVNRDSKHLWYEDLANETWDVDSALMVEAMRYMPGKLGPIA